MFSAKYDRTRNCILTNLGMQNRLTGFGLSKFSRWHGRPGCADALGMERVISLSMPEPFSAIRDAAASRRRALGAVSRITANGGGIDVLRGSAAEGRGYPAPILKCPPPPAALRARPRAPCFQLTLKKLQFLYFIGMSSFLVKATSVE